MAIFPAAEPLFPHGEFPIGVWLQDPLAAHPYDQRPLAQHWREHHFNHLIGIYQWPSEAIRHPGYNVRAAQAAKDSGLLVYAGNDEAAVDWIKQHEAEFGSTFIGYLLGDEPDMTKRERPDHHPDAWLARCNMLRTLDPTRGRYANFGKGFAKIPWRGYTAFPGPTIQDDHDKFTAQLTCASVDIYMTDKYEMPDYAGPWIYGRAVKNARAYTPAGLPVWGVVETGNPFPQTGGLYPMMPPHLVPVCVWHAVCSGADGIMYFPQTDLEGSRTGISCIEVPNGPLSLMTKATNWWLHFYAQVLRQPTIATTKVEASGVGVVTVTKHWQGSAWVFAMGDGSETVQHGERVEASFEVAGASGQPVEVMTEGRSLHAAGGKFGDVFAPYQLHVYRVPLGRAPDAPDVVDAALS